jgi:hypothetical protein
MGKKYSFSQLEFFAKEFFWYAIISFFQDEFNPSYWTIWDNFATIIMFVIFQLYVLGSCLTEENKEEENGN